MSPENECPRFKQNAWKKELCSNCFRPKEEHPQKPKRVQVDYKPLPEISPSQSILKVNGSCEKSLNVSFSNVEFEIIGYGGEEYSTDDDYSDADDDYDNGRSQECGDSGEDEQELKRLTETNTNMNGRLNIPEKNAGVPVAAVVAPAKTSTTPKASLPNVTAEKASSPPLVTIKPFGEQQPQQSLVYSFLKNKEMAAAAKKETPATNTAAVMVPAATVDDGEKIVADTGVANEDVQTRKTETKKSLARSSLLASSNEPFLLMKRSSVPAAEVAVLTSPSVQAPLQDLPTKKDPAAVVVVVVPAPPPPPPPPETIKTERLPLDAVPEGPPTPPKEPEAAATDAGGLSAYKTRSNVPRMGTKHFKIKLPVAPIPFQKPVDACKSAETAESLTSRELAGEPDGKADSDEPGDQQLPPVAPTNRSFLHTFSKEKSPPPLPPCDTPPRTPLRKTSSSSPPDCPRSIKRQAPKPPPTPPSPMVTCASNNVHHRGRHISVCSVTDDECEGGRGPDETTTANRKLLAEYCEQIEREQRQNRDIESPQPVDDAASRESSTLPLPNRRPSYEKKKYGKAAKVGSKIKKFLRLPSKDLTTASPQQSTRPKLEIIHPLDINKSGVQIIHNMELIHSSIHNVKGLAHHHSARPSKPPPPPRSLPPQPTASKENSPKLTDYSDVPKACDSSTSDETYEPINYSAPECDHSSPELARLTSMQYCGSETESEIYPAIQFGDDFGVEDSIRNTQTTGHKSLEESYDAVVIANHEALTKLLDQASSGPKIPKELMVLQTNGLKWSSFYVDSTSRLQKGDYAFYNSKWYDVPVVLSISAKQIKLNHILNNHFTLTKVSQFIDCVGKEFSMNNENEDSYVTLWNAHRIESIESYCKEYNAKYSDVTKEAGLILVETINLLMGLQTSNIEKYSLQPFVITRNFFGTDPSVAVIQVENDPKDEDTLCNIMLNVLKMLAPSWEMTVCLSQVLRQGKANSLSKCKALLEFWLWGPTGVTVSPDRPLSLKRWLDLERANTLHGHVCARSTNLTIQQICYMSFLVANDDKLFTEAWTVMAGKKLRPPRDPTISKC